MNEWRRSRFGNPAAWFAVLGAGLLAFSLWLPWLGASRTTRVEKRADGLAEALLEAARGFVSPLDEAERQAVMARFIREAACRGERVKDLERAEIPGDGIALCLINKHYAFQLAESPPQPKQRPGVKTIPAWEVIAWPLGSVGPGHSAFFYAENASRAYSRNLRSSYAGFASKRFPLPGAGHRRPGEAGKRPWQYPGNDNGRWIIY